MKLNHLDIPVTDAERAAGFLVTHFGFTLREVKGNHGLMVLDGADGFELVLTKQANAEGAAHRKSLHIGFMLEARNEVETIHARLANEPTCRLSPISSMRGTTQFYCHAPGELLVEIGWRPADQASGS